MNLRFSGIYEVKASANKNGLNFIALKGNQPHFKGVYVWGFKFNEGKDPFMPYYVGQAGGIGAEDNESTIYKRLLAHYMFKPGNYHVIKKEELPLFNTFIQTDEQINQIAIDCFSGQITLAKRDKSFNDYKNHFDYLNKRQLPDFKKYQALNALQSERVVNKKIEDSILFYQNNFYACWIEYPVFPDRQSVTKKTQQEILVLEKYIHTLVKNKNNQKIIGKDLSLGSKELANLLQNYPQFKKIKKSQLGTDIFI